LRISSLGYYYDNGDVMALPLYISNCRSFGNRTGKTCDANDTSVSKLVMENLHTLSKITVGKREQGKLQESEHPARRKSALI